MFLSECITHAGDDQAAAEFTFDQYEVVIGSAKRQTVLTGFLLGGDIAEIAVVNIDGNHDDRRLRIYAFGDGTWVPYLDTTLRRQVLFVDVANINGRDRLVTYEPDRLNWFDPDTATEHALVTVTSNFNPPRSGEIPHVDLTRDLNDDNCDDLVVPDIDGFWVFIQMSDGAFADPVKVGASAEMGRIYGADGSTMFAPEIDAAFRSDDSVQLGMRRHDFDCDGRIDLTLTTIDLDFLESSLWKRLKGFMGDDIWLNLEFYHMEGGLYPDKPNTTRRIALDGAPSHREPGWVPLDIVLRGGTHESRDTQKNYLRAFNRTLLIGDVTGDGRSDLLIEWTHKQLCVYAGVPEPELFARQPQKVSVPLPNDGEYTWLVDLNKDGVQDILMHHPFTLRDAHGAPNRRPGTEPHRVTMLIAR